MLWTFRTPLQNKLSDLWALMDFAQPGLLGNHATFERNFSEQIAKGSKRNATRFDVELKDVESSKPLMGLIMTISITIFVTHIYLYIYIY